MSLRVTDIIEAEAPETRDLAIARWCAGRSTAELLRACGKLELYRRRQTNLLLPASGPMFFLSAIHRYHLPARPDFPAHRRRALRGFSGCSSGASKRRSPGFCAPREAAGRQRNPLQRPRRRLPRARLPNPRRSGAAHRPGHAGQRVDIPPRPSARTSRLRVRPELLRAGGGHHSSSGPARAHARADGSDPLRLERHSFSSAWISPRSCPGAQCFHRLGLAWPGRRAAPARSKRISAIIDEPVIRLASVRSRSIGRGAGTRRGV